MNIYYDIIYPQQNKLWPKSCFFFWMFWWLSSSPARGTCVGYQLSTWIRQKPGSHKAVKGAKNAEVFMDLFGMYGCEWIWYLEAGYLPYLKKSMEKRSQSLWRKQIKPDTQLKNLLSSSWTESSSWDGFSKNLDMSENRTSSMISTAWWSFVHQVWRPCMSWKSWKLICQFRAWQSGSGELVPNSLGKHRKSIETKLDSTKLRPLRWRRDWSKTRLSELLTSSQAAMAELKVITSFCTSWIKALTRGANDAKGFIWLWPSVFSQDWLTSIWNCQLFRSCLYFLVKIWLFHVKKNSAVPQDPVYTYLHFKK